MKKNKSPRYKLPLPSTPLPDGKRRVVICIPDDDDWAAMFWGQLHKMGWWVSYERDEDKRAKDVARAWFDVVEEARRAYLGLQPATCDFNLGDCVDYPAQSMFIDYQPQNPFTDPGLVPSGYMLPPFTVVKDTDILLLALGYQEGDILTDITRIPTWSPPFPMPEGGYTRFRISVTRKSEIELHFLSMPIGGIALVTKNGEIGTAQIVDLGFNVVEGQPTTIDEIIEEVAITDETGGYIDVTFLPLPSPESLVRYGGGFRSVTICQEVSMTDFDVRQNEEEPCKLQKKEGSGSWETFADITLCLKNSIVDTGGGLEIITDGVATPISGVPDDADPRTRARATRLVTDDEIKCLASANASNVMQKVVEEAIAKYKLYPWMALLVIMSLVLSVAFGTGWGVLAIPFIPATAAMLVLASLTSGAYGAKEFREFACILYTNCTVTDGKHYFNFNAVKTAVVAKQPSFAFNVWNAVYSILDIIGEDGLNVAGDTTAITDPCCDFCSTGTQSTYLYLNAEPYYGSFMSKNTNNVNLISKSANGFRMSANGTTVYFRWDFAFQAPPGCEVTDLGVYMTNGGEPFFVGLYLNQTTTPYKSYSNYRPFGQFHYTGAVSLLPGVNRLVVAGYNNNTTTGYFEIQRVYAVYRGCDPFLYYR